MKYRRKPEIVDAFQLREIGDWPDWAQESFGNQAFPDGVVFVHTPLCGENDVEIAYPGDYIVRHENGDMFTYTAESFEATYDCDLSETRDFCHKVLYGRGSAENPCATIQEAVNMIPTGKDVHAPGFVYVEPKQKMVLVPMAALSSLKARVEDDHPVYHHINEIIANAPIAAIPLKEVPTEGCHNCPARQFTEMEYVYCDLYEGKENTDAHWENHSKPADCPIVTKE